MWAFATRKRNDEVKEGPEIHWSWKRLFASVFAANCSDLIFLNKMLDPIDDDIYVYRVLVCF